MAPRSNLVNLEDWMLVAQGSPVATRLTWCRSSGNSLGPQEVAATRRLAHFALPSMKSVSLATTAIFISQEFR